MYHKFLNFHLILCELTLFKKCCNTVNSSGPNRAALGNRRDKNFPMSHVREIGKHECDLRCHQQARSTASVRMMSKCVASVARNTLLMFQADDWMLLKKSYCLEFRVGF
jgi:hypothetical protein